MKKVMLENPKDVVVVADELSTQAFFVGGKGTLVWIYMGEMYIWSQCCYLDTNNIYQVEATMRTWIGLFTNNRLVDVNMFTPQDAIKFAFNRDSDAEIYMPQGREELIDLINTRGRELL